MGTILWGAPDFGVVGAILVGSIPGILIGSHFTARMNQRVLRGSSPVCWRPPGLKLLGARRSFADQRCSAVAGWFASAPAPSAASLPPVDGELEPQRV